MHICVPYRVIPLPLPTGRQAAGRGEGEGASTPKCLKAQIGMFDMRSLSQKIRFPFQYDHSSL